MKEVSRVVVLKKGDKAVENQLFSLYCEPVEWHTMTGSCTLPNL